MSHADDSNPFLEFKVYRVLMAEEQRLLSHNCMTRVSIEVSANPVF